MEHKRRREAAEHIKQIMAGSPAAVDLADEILAEPEWSTSIPAECGWFWNWTGEKTDYPSLMLITYHIAWQKFVISYAMTPRSFRPLQEATGFWFPLIGPQRPTATETHELAGDKLQVIGETPPADESKTFSHIETQARNIGRLIGATINQGPTANKYGFALMIFSFKGPEFTWISNADRNDMTRALDEFLKRLEDGTATIS